MGWGCFTRKGGGGTLRVREQSLFHIGKILWFGPPPLETLNHIYFLFFFLLKREKIYVVIGEIDFFGEKKNAFFFLRRRREFFFCRFLDDFFLYIENEKKNGSMVWSTPQNA